MDAMAIPAFIEKAPSGGTARSTRRTLRLRLQGRAGGGDLNVSVHNISATGLLLEGDAALAVDDRVDIDLPHAGVTRARVIWVSGSLYGCQFETPISSATLSAAQLRAVVSGDRTEDVPANEPADESFGDRLHRLRTARRLTQLEIAGELGVSEQSISAWEQNKARPKAGRIKALAILLNVEVTELLGIDEAHSLRDVVARAKAQVAEAAAISADNVKIIIEI
ncbi:helix-turn-helix domain-containing protein [Sphingopyxis microcysteis]|uniref:helix-turn-helix domain-containing protein n=1 Tax=Sphingopyxis microcysteis TaxID=2484145 RepID=UPI0014468279|nr:helix-turn-helix domain-containing protein [Sphingopyxis microcysteis]